ncbi:MAG: hypothetical protein ABWZ67_06380, partial [Solirubrobacteraceae bacterium]
MPRTLTGIVAAVAATGWLVTTAAPAQAPLALAADLSETGYVGLRLTAAPGTAVTVAERIGGSLEPLATVTPEAGLTTLPR